MIKKVSFNKPRLSNQGYWLNAPQSYLSGKITKREENPVIAGVLVEGVLFQSREKEMVSDFCRGFKKR